MSLDKLVRRIGDRSTGVIGASWTALYLVRGFNVVATNPSLNAEARLRQYVDAVWPVQEKAPERQDFKIKLFADIDASTPPDSIIASNS